MKTQLSNSSLTALETECLVAVVLDRGEKDKTEALVSADKALQEAAAEVIASGEASGKPLETTLLHHPAKLKAKRLLLVGGGKSKKFAASDLRKLAGTVVRALKAKGIRSFAFVAPEGLDPTEAVKAIVEGAFVGSF